MKNYVYVPGLTETVQKEAEKAKKNKELSIAPKKKPSVTKDRGVIREKPVDDRNYSIPLWHKYGMNLREASDYFGIGIDRLREYLFAHASEGLYLMNGNRMVIKRKCLEEHFDRMKEM